MVKAIKIFWTPMYTSNLIIYAQNISYVFLIWNVPPIHFTVPVSVLTLRWLPLRFPKIVYIPFKKNRRAKARTQLKNYFFKATKDRCATDLCRYACQHVLDVVWLQQKNKFVFCYLSKLTCKQVDMYYPHSTKQSRRYPKDIFSRYSDVQKISNFSDKIYNRWQMPRCTKAD